MPPPRPIALSFSGSGHLLTYQLGVAQHLLVDSTSAWAERVTHFAGASGGAIAAAACALLPREHLKTFAKEAAIRGRSFNEMTDALAGHGKFAISEDVVARTSAGQTLFLSATHCRTGTNVLFSRFSSAAALQKCLHASAAIPKSFHPFDLTRSRPTYAEAGGIIVPSECEADGGLAASARDGAATGEQLPFSPHGEAYVDGGITNTAPVLQHVVRNAHTLTVSPVSGPQGCLQPASTTATAHWHLTPLDTSPRLPLVAPKLAGMRCYLSVDNIRALQTSMGAGPRTLERWYERGQQDAERFLSMFGRPSD